MKPPALTDQEYQVRWLGQLHCMRMDRWSIAVHNDYYLNGEFHTFWLLTNNRNQFVKGEGKSDAEAIDQAFTAYLGLPDE